MRRRHTPPARRRSYRPFATPSGAHPFASAPSSARRWLRALAAQAWRGWGQRRVIQRRWRGAPLSGGLALCALVAACAGLLVAAPATVGTAAAAGGTPFAGTTNAPQVAVAVDLHDPQLHPQQLAYDAGRDSLWFWTSKRRADSTVEDRVYQYALKGRQLRSWPLSGGDWSTQVLAGLAVAPDGTIWIGWNHQLVRFHPSDGSSTVYALPAQPRYPLPADILRGLPGDLGIADVAVARDGTVWLARAGALSLTRFDPPTQTFTEVPLPTTAGDPAKLTVGPDGHLFFTMDLAADQPGAICARRSSPAASCPSTPMGRRWRPTRVGGSG